MKTNAISKRRKEDRTDIEFPNNCVPGLCIWDFYVEFTLERTQEPKVRTTRKELEITYHLLGERRADIGYKTETFNRKNYGVKNVYDQQVEISPVVLAFLQEELPPYMRELLPKPLLVKA